MIITHTEWPVLDRVHRLVWTTRATCTAAAALADDSGAAAATARRATAARAAAPDSAVHAASTVSIASDHTASDRASPASHVC